MFKNVHELVFHYKRIHPFLSLSISEDENFIKLEMIKLPIIERKRGIGTDVIEALIEYSEQNNKWICLTPANIDWSTNVEKLRKWYRSFGFVKNGGNYRDFRFREVYYRKCKNELNPLTDDEK